MASMLNRYNAYVKQDIAELDKAIGALIKAKRHVSQIEQRQAAKTRKQERYEKRRAELKNLLKRGKTEEADTIMLEDTGAKYFPVRFIKPNRNSPRKTLKHLVMKGVAAKGGPIHRNLLGTKKRR